MITTTTKTTATVQRRQQTNKQTENDNIYLLSSTDKLTRTYLMLVRDKTKTARDWTIAKKTIN